MDPSTTELVETTVYRFVANPQTGILELQVHGTQIELRPIVGGTTPTTARRRQPAPA